MTLGGRETERETKELEAHNLCHEFRINISHVIRKGKSYKRYMHAHIFSIEYGTIFTHFSDKVKFKIEASLP